MTDTINDSNNRDDSSRSHDQTGSRWSGKPGKGKSAQATHVATMREINEGGEAGYLWRTTQDHRRVRVMAVAESYAMVRRLGCAPYLCKVEELFENDEHTDASNE